MRLTRGNDLVGGPGETLPDFSAFEVAPAKLGLAGFFRDYGRDAGLLPHARVLGDG